MFNYLKEEMEFQAGLCVALLHIRKVGRFVSSLNWSARAEHE
jgi:hypothetical protein